MASGDVSPVQYFSSVLATAMHHRAGDALEHSFIGKLERVNDLEKCRHILQARRTDFAGEAGDIE
jgi:hypothetical protein